MTKNLKYAMMIVASLMICVIVISLFIYLINSTNQTTNLTYKSWYNSAQNDKCIFTHISELNKTYCKSITPSKYDMHPVISVRSTTSIEISIELMLKFTDYICDTILIPGNISCTKQEKKLDIRLCNTYEEWENIQKEEGLELNFNAIGWYKAYTHGAKIFVLCMDYISCVETFLHEVAHGIGHLTLNNLSEGFAEFAPQLYMYPSNMYTRDTIIHICKNINNFNILDILGEKDTGYKYAMNNLLLQYYYQYNITQFYNLIKKHGNGEAYIHIFNKDIAPDNLKFKLFIKRIGNNINDHLADNFSHKFIHDLKDIESNFEETKMILKQDKYLIKVLRLITLKLNCLLKG